MQTYGREKHLLQVKLNLFLILAFKDILKQECNDFQSKKLIRLSF